MVHTVLVLASKHLSLVYHDYSNTDMHVLETLELVFSPHHINVYTFTPKIGFGFNELSCAVFVCTVTGPLSELQIAYVGRETLQVRSYSR